MDSIKGAQILSELLVKLNVSAAPAAPPLKDQTALPLFHWLGVEPASAAPDVAFD
jgi:hypothetical protein